jgi:hypothetical protein
MESNDMDTIYADGVANVTLIDSVVRLDLVRLTQVDRQNDKAQVQPVATVAVSLPGLLRLHDQVGKVVDELVNQGVLTRKTPEALPTAEESAAETDKKA